MSSDLKAKIRQAELAIEGCDSDIKKAEKHLRALQQMGRESSYEAMNRRRTIEDRKRSKKEYQDRLIGLRSELAKSNGNNK